jgi:zinc carboxypeptidase
MVSRVTTLLDNLPPIDAFPTVDEMYDFAERMVAKYPDRATLRTIGRSRDGGAIQLLSLTSPRARGDVLVVGQPHPNEPIGMATITTLCERLIADPDALETIGASWHFVPCVDPDGTRLNEGWFAGPWTLEHYARNFYRPGPEAQVEWTFPFSAGDFSIDAPMPETVALMAAIDEVRPTVLASLHNAELGGAYYYVTSGDDALYARLTDLCAVHDIPLHRGEPETALSDEFAPAIFSMPRASQLYDYAVASGFDPAVLVSGGSSLDYAERHDTTFGLAIELPYWRDRRATDLRADPSGASRREVAVRGLDLQESTTATLRSFYDGGDPLPPSPLADAVGSFLRLLESGYIDAQRQATQGAEFGRPATVAEAFSAVDGYRMLRLRIGGMLLRALPVDAACRPDAERTFAEWCAEADADSQAEVIPIADLVAVQGGAILACAAHAL